MVENREGKAVVEMPKSKKSKSRSKSRTASKSTKRKTSLFFKNYIEESFATKVYFLTNPKNSQVFKKISVKKIDLK